MKFETVTRGLFETDYLLVSIDSYQMYFATGVFDVSTGVTTSTITFRKNGRTNWTVVKTDIGMFTVTFASPHPSATRTS